MERIWTLTTNHPASSHGMPVAVINRTPYGPMDQLNGRPIAEEVKAWALEPDRTEDDRALAGRFLRQWPDGPQLPGRPHQFEPSSQRSVRLNDTDLEAIEKSGISLNAFVRKAVREKVERDLKAD